MIKDILALTGAIVFGLALMGAVGLIDFHFIASDVRHVCTKVGADHD